MVSSEQTRDNGHKPKYNKTCLNLRKHFFTVREVKHWNRLSREVMESPSVEITKNMTGHCPDQAVLVDPALGRGVELGDIFHSVKI